MIGEPFSACGNPRGESGVLPRTRPLYILFPSEIYPTSHQFPFFLNFAWCDTHDPLFPIFFCSVSIPFPFIALSF